MYEHDNENNKNNAKQIDKESFNSTLVATGTFSGLEILNRDEKLIKNFCEELEKKLGKPLHYVGDDGKIKMIELRESLIDDAIKIFVGNNPESSLHIYFDIDDKKSFGLRYLKMLLVLVIDISLINLNGDRVIAIKKQN